MATYKKIFFLLFLIHFSAKAQLSSDLTIIQKQVGVMQNPPLLSTPKTVKIQKSYNPLKVIPFTFLFVYQKVLSEQFFAGCEFDRSCSAFGVGCFKEFGVFKALFLTADRLTRCNGVAQLETQNYLFNHLSGKIIDEPKMYRFNN